MKDLSFGKIKGYNKTPATERPLAPAEFRRYTPDASPEAWENSGASLTDDPDNT